MLLQISYVLTILTILIFRNSHMMHSYYRSGCSNLIDISTVEYASFMAWQNYGWISYRPDVLPSKQNHEWHQSILITYVAPFKLKH